jgi:hypothetical protein
MLDAAALDDRPNIAADNSSMASSQEPMEGCNDQIH